MLTAPLATREEYPGGLVLRIRQNGPGTSHCSLAFIQDSLKRSRVYFKKKIARPDRLPFLIAAFLNNSRHAGTHFRLEIRFHTAGKIGGYGNLSTAYRHDRHFRHGFTGQSGCLAFTLPLAGEANTSRGMQNKRLIIFIRNHAVWNLKKPRNRTSGKTGDFSIAI